MKEDVRDRALGEALDREVGALEPTRGQLAEIRRRGAHRRVVRWTAIGTALAVFVGALGLAAAVWGDRDSLPVASTWKTFDDAGAGWTMRYPASWTFSAIDDRACAATSVRMGAFISNIPFRLRHPGGATKGACNTDTWVMTDFPAGGVGLEIEPVSGTFGPHPMGPDTRFPMRLMDLRHAVRPHSGPRELYASVFSGGRWLMNVRLYLGSRHSRSDARLASMVLASLRLATAAPISPSPATHPRLGRQCVFSKKLAADPLLRRSRTKVGNLDGDRRADGAWIVDVPGRPDRCSRFLVVWTGTGPEGLVARLPEWWAPQLPKITALANVDPEPGSEIVVTFDAGGFSQQVAIFSLRDGKLVPLRIFEILLVADATRKAANLDCAGGPGSGEIVWATTGSRLGSSTNVLRRFYQLHGTRFQLEVRKTERSHVPTSWINTARMRAVAPELSDLNAIFPSCSTTRRFQP